MDCKVFKCISKTDVYLFVEAGENMQKIPGELSDGLGTLEFVMDLELNSEMKLARSDPDEIICSIKKNGFYLQIPPANINLDFLNSYTSLYK